MKKILMDLHPCSDGYAGIPQDTRVSFSLLTASERYAVGGHLFDRSHGTTGFPWDAAAEGDALITQMSEYAIAFDSGHRRYDSDMANFWLLAAWLKLIKSKRWGRRATRYLIDRAYLKPDPRLYRFDAKFFHDFIWRTLFEKSLSADKKKQVVSSEFVAGSCTRALMNRVLEKGRGPLDIDASGWDAYISQTGFPGNIKGGAKLIVRCHDLVPIQNPTTIKNPYLHSQAVVNTLRHNVKDAYFVCNSHTTRDQLLQLYPRLEERTHVVPCCVPDVFSKSDVSAVGDIVAKRINHRAIDQSQFFDLVRFKTFIKERFNEDYFLAVGTLEPRKNYLTIIEAWNLYRKKTGKDIKLVIVGNDGWGEDILKNQIKAYCQSGDLFLLDGVGSYELLDLYSRARACVVASYAEGFSYPGVEAMRCSTPIVASDIPVHREVYGEWVRYFDPYSKQDLARALDALVNSTADEIEKMTLGAREHSLRFAEPAIQKSWEAALDSIV